MCLGEVFQFFQRGFLKHEIQGFRLIPVRDKHTMMCGEQRVYPQSIAHHICIGNLLKRLLRTDIYVTTGNQRTQSFGSPLHYLFVKWELKG